MFESLLPNLPEKGPAQLPFVASTITRRPARGAQAANFARTVAEDGNFYLDDHMACLPYPKGKNATIRDARNETPVGSMVLERNTLKAIAFRDSSLLLCGKDAKGWFIYPEIFAVQSTHIVEQKQTIKTRMDTPHSFLLYGDATLIQPLEAAFWESATWWQRHLETLPTPSITLDGFIPSFTEFPTIKEEKRQSAISALGVIAKFILVHTELTEVSIRIPFITPDVRSIKQGVKAGLYGRAETQGFYQNISRPYRDLLKSAILAPTFPIQGMEWMQSADVNPNANRNTDIIVNVGKDALSAHDKIQAMADFHHYFPSTPMP